MSQRCMHAWLLLSEDIIAIYIYIYTHTDSLSLSIYIYICDLRLYFGLIVVFPEIVP